MNKIEYPNRGRRIAPADPDDQSNDMPRRGRPVQQDSITLPVEYPRRGKPVSESDSPRQLSLDSDDTKPKINHPILASRYSAEPPALKVDELEPQQRSEHQPTTVADRHRLQLKAALAVEFNYWATKPASEFVHIVMQAIDDLYVESQQEQKENAME